MVPTSSAQKSASDERRTPAVEMIGPRTAAFAETIPHGFVPYTLGYVLVDEAGGGHVIDPGSGCAGSTERVLAAVKGAGAGRLESIIITHQHFDHLGAAAALRDATGCRILMHRAEWASIIDPAPFDVVGDFARWGAPSGPRLVISESRTGTDHALDAQPNALLEDGEGLDIPGRDVRVLHTPGHTHGSITVRDAGERLLFTGDTILPTVYPGITGRDGIAHHLRTLDQLTQFDDHEVLPGHGFRFRGLSARLGSIRDHVLSRAADVARSAAAVPSGSVYEIAERMRWSRPFENLEGYLLYSALAQTELYLQFLDGPHRERL